MNILDYKDRLNEERARRVGPRSPQNWGAFALKEKYSNPNLVPKNWEEWVLKQEQS